MRIIAGLFCAAIGVSMLSGCQGAKKELLSVDFKQDQTLRYKQVSERETKLDFDPGGKISKGRDEGRIQTITEKLEIVVAYKPVKIDQRGFDVVAATFESITPSRSSLTAQHQAGRDAVSYLSGKTITFTISPSGIITDPCGFNEAVKQMGKEAFGGKSSEGGIKDPDMIEDFMALQRMMWDAISSIKNPAQGVAVGQTWQSLLMAPMSMPVRVGRDITYKLGDVREINGSRIADINSVCKLSDKALSPADWPVPYTGSFRMRGLFGFLSGYSVLSLAGSGAERFNIDAGRVEKIQQQYEAGISAQMPFALGSAGTTPSPNMVVRQKLSVELLSK